MLKFTSQYVSLVEKILRILSVEDNTSSVDIYSVSYEWSPKSNLNYENFRSLIFQMEEQNLIIELPDTSLRITKKGKMVVVIGGIKAFNRFEGLYERTLNIVMMLLSLILMIIASYYLFTF